MFASQGQAKRFFADKIAAQATREGHPLSENERWMLSFSESDPEFVVDHSRVTALAAEIPDAQYEDKVAGLAQRACASDIASNPRSLGVLQGSLSRPQPRRSLHIDHAQGRSFTMATAMVGILVVTDRRLTSA